MKKLMEVINKDASLKTTILGKSIILQEKDPDRNNQLCDIDEDDAVPDKSDVHVLLMPVASSLAEMHLASALIIISAVESEAFNANVDLSTFENSTTEPPLAIDDGNLLPSINNPALRENDSNGNYTINRQLNVGSSNNCYSIHPVPSASRDADRKQKFILPNSPLPSLTLDLEKKLAEDGILKAQKNFISFWASYLWEATNTKPTKFDYHNLATSIVQAYPDLKGGANECGIVRTQLSVWIRNHRAGMKRSTSKKRDHEGNCKAPSSQAVFVENNTEITFEVIVTQIDTCIDKLTNFCTLSETNNKTLTIINYLCRELGYKRLKQGMKDLIVIKQAMKSTDDLETVEGEAPRCVVYTLDQEIISAYIVADACVQMEIPNADIHKIVAGVLASYYVWHRNFPSDHRNMLQYLDHVILNAPDQKLSLVVTKFIRKLNH